MRKNMKKGFTLLEILLVIAAIGILAAIVIVALNPTRQLDQAVAVRQEANAILDSTEQYLIDNNQYPDEVEALGQSGTGIICASGVDEATCISEGLLHLEDDLVPTYLADIPEQDSVSSNSSGYGIVKNGNRVGVYAIRNPESDDPDTIFLGIEPNDYLAALPGKLLWLRPDVGIAEVSGAVSVWEDQSGLENHFRQSNVSSRPALVQGELNSFSGVEFDGSNDHLISDNFIFASDQELTMMFVARAVASSNTLQFMYDFGNFASRHYGVTLSPTAFSVTTADNFGGDFNSVFDDYTSYSLHTAHVDFGTSQSLRVNRNEISSSPITLPELSANEISESSGRSSGSGPPTLGMQSKTFSDSSRKFRGAVVEVFFLEGELSDSEIRSIEDVIMDKYEL